MPVHRKQAIRVLDDHDSSRVVRSRVDHVTISDRVDARAHRGAFDRVPVLGGVPPAWIEPGVLRGVAVSNNESIAERAARCTDWVAVQGGWVDGLGSRRRWRGR